MDLERLINQQHQEIQAYKVARDVSWNKMKEEHKQIATALGGPDKVPPDIKSRFDSQVAKYNKEWPMYTGERHRALTEKHDKQREALTGKAKPEQQKQVAKAKNDNNPLSDDKQAKLQKIIVQQQAIHKRQQEQKHKRK